MNVAAGWTSLLPLVVLLLFLEKSFAKGLLGVFCEECEEGVPEDRDSPVDRTEGAAGTIVSGESARVNA